MKTVKFLASMLLVASCICLTGCDKEETEAPTSKPTSDKVTTGEASEITGQSAVLAGKVNVDIKDYTSVEFGMMVSDNVQDMNNRKGEKVWGKTLIGSNYTVEIDGLTGSTKYYYCAFVFLNETQYEFGAIKDFTTQEIAVVKNEGFSVSAGKQVRFSPGNLQYSRSTGTWSFADNQYDMIGDANVSGSALADKIDLFGWSGSTGSAKWGISTSDDNSDYSGDFVDWGRNIGDGTTWYTLTYDEWDYLLDERPNANNLRGVARINLDSYGSKYANGLVLLPDDWTCPAGVAFKSGFASDYSVQAYADYQTFTLSDWQKLEAAGAVFLPASGYRYGSNVYDVQDDGYYWSATPYVSDYANFLYFNSYEARTYSDWYRDRGQAVRLVQDLIK